MTWRERLCCLGTSLSATLLRFAAAIPPLADHLQCAAAHRLLMRRMTSCDRKWILAKQNRLLTSIQGRMEEGEAAC